MKANRTLAMLLALFRVVVGYGQAHYVTPYPIQLDSGERQTVLLEELTPGAAISLLQLPVLNGQPDTIEQKLPRIHSPQWRTQRPWYIWFDGRLIAPDSFVRTELDALLTLVPESVQRWAAVYPRPTNPKTLVRWLAGFEQAMHQAQAKPVTPSGATLPQL